VNRAAEELLFEREVVIAASLETIWQFLVDPERAVLWMGLEASFDPRPGGRYRITVLSGAVASGEFVEVDPPRRLVYTWGWEASDSVLPGSTIVQFDLTPTAGGTLLRLTHRHLPDAASAASHARGWTHYLARLAIAAAGGDPGPDPWREEVQQ
jgi:uncharacterized protein YndB with AHSA1/START domain